MKKIRMTMTVVFALAIAAAYAGRERTTVLFNDSEHPVVGEGCQQFTSGCNNTSLRTCDVVAYQIHATGDNPCEILLQKKD